MDRIYKLVRHAAVVVAIPVMAALCASGCVGCRSCGGDDGKPVAPETYSDSGSEDGSPSLPYIVPWWVK